MRKLIIISSLILSILSAADNKLSKATFNQLQKAQKFIKNHKFRSASDVLNSILKKDSSNTAKSYALQALANIAIHNNRYPQAIKHYEQIVKYNAMPPEDILKIKFSLSQLYLSEGIYSKSIKYSTELLNINYAKKAKIYENLALAYYYNNQYSKSIKYIKIVIEQKKKKTSWYKMLYSSYVETKNYGSAIRIMKILLAKDRTNEDYWMQLISLYQTMRNYKKSLATIELAYKKNIISKSKNLMYFVNILLQNNIYNKAAIMMEDGIKKGLVANNKKNFNIMISSYLNAKNYKKAIPFLTTSPYANTNKFKLLLGNIYYNYNNYKKAIATLKNFNFTKNSSHDGQRYTLLALSYYELDKKENVESYLKKAYSNKYERKRAASIARSLGIKI